MIRTLVFTMAAALAVTSSAQAQAIGGPEKGRPVAGDPGISSMVVMDRPDFRVLRDWAEAGAVRRMHNHADATYHVFTLLTGQLTLTIEGQEPVEVKAGDVVDLKGGVMHTFKNTGNGHRDDRRGLRQGAEAVVIAAREARGTRSGSRQYRFAPTPSCRPARTRSDE